MHAAARSTSVLTALIFFALAGCGQETAIDEQGSSPAEAPAVAALEPRHGGHMVELSGDFDAELVISESGMCFVYLYDEQGQPVPYEGKQVKLSVTAPDGTTEILPLEGMGAGAGAHFMNPVSEEMLPRLGTPAAYYAELEVVTTTGLQTGRVEVAADVP